MVRDLRYTIAVPIRETLKVVDSDTWLIGPLILRRSKGPSDTATWFDEVDNSSYTITDAPTPQPPTTLLVPNTAPIVQIHDMGDASAVWSIGSKVFCKVHVLYPHHNATSEALR